MICTGRENFSVLKLPVVITAEQSATKSTSGSLTPDKRDSGQFSEAADLLDGAPELLGAVV